MDVAAAINKDQSRISKAETGDQNLRFHDIAQIAVTLGVSLDYLAGLTNDPRPAADRPITKESEKQSYTVSKELELEAQGYIAAIQRSGRSAFRRSVTGEPRGPVCGMGICYECRVTVNGVANQRSCLLLCEPGMEIHTDG